MRSDESSSTRTGSARRRGSDDSSWRRRLATQRAANPDPRPASPVLPTLVPHGSQVAYRADFSDVRYGQCWEDTDVLLAGLDIVPGDTCLSVCSAGDNALAMLARDPARVIAVDLNPAQLACLELRMAAYRTLEYDDLLVLMGSRRGFHRAALYATCREQLSRGARAFWDARPELIQLGLGGAGKFERAVDHMRRIVLPLVHPRADIERLMIARTRVERYAHYDREWDTWGWRTLFRLLFSRPAMAWVAHDLASFTAQDGQVAERVLSRARLHLAELGLPDNPYAHWLLTGGHGTALPFALRRENVKAIRANLDRLEWRLCAIDDVLNEVGSRVFDRFNLGDSFEYLAEPAYHTLLYRLARAGRRGARLAYWNRFVDRRRPPEMAESLRSLDHKAEQLFRTDRTLFASRFVIEEVV
jgi:S-adenosylmethionine-diacylglycerol 3-amino-3-carboxypropyl transferase